VGTSVEWRVVWGSVKKKMKMAISEKM